MEQDKTILVVDDFTSIRRVIADTLSRYGFNTIEAENGINALEVLKQNSQKVDLILSDYNMPEMGGFELLENVKSDPKLKSIPFILLTSESNREKMKQAKNAGLDAWIQKPYKIEAFINQLKYSIEKNAGNVGV